MMMVSFMFFHHIERARFLLVVLNVTDLKRKVKLCTSLEWIRPNLHPKCVEYVVVEESILTFALKSSVLSMSSSSFSPRVANVSATNEHKTVHTARLEQRIEVGSDHRSLHLRLKHRSFLPMFLTMMPLSSSTWPWTRSTLSSEYSTPWYFCSESNQ